MLHRFGQCGFALLILLTSAACGSEQSGAQPSNSAPPSNAPTSTVFLSPASATPVDDLAGNCSVSQVMGLIQNFSNAYNAGSPDQLGQYFDLDRFEYFVGGSKANQPFEEIRTSSRPELLAYLSQRHIQHEQIQMVDTPDVSLDGTRANSVLAVVDVSRRADDFPKAQAKVKSVIDCKTRKIFRWIWYGFELT